jgi:cell division protein FtsW (lipid II flippase)
MRRMSSWIAIGIILCVTGAAAAQAVPPSPSGVDVIMAYAGTWKVHGEHFATAYSQVGKEDKTLRNDCWKSGAYVACNQYVDGDSKVLLVFTYNDKDKTYTSYQIPQGGDAAGSGKLQIEGNIWTFPWQVTQGETTMYFHVVNVFNADHIDYAQEFSPDNVHWTAMAKGSETRVSK